MKIAHNGIKETPSAFIKDQRGIKSEVYALGAQALAGFLHILHRGKFFEWPLSLSPKLRSAREFLYQQIIDRRLKLLGNQIDGVTIDAIQFQRLKGTQIEMERLDHSTSLDQLLQDPDRIKDSDTLAQSIRAYGVWMRILNDDGIVAECNHPGNVLIDQDNERHITVIDFENYSGSHQDDKKQFSSEQLWHHKMLDPFAVDSILSLALDIGLLAQLKISPEQKIYYITNFLSGYFHNYQAGFNELCLLLDDDSIKNIGMIRSYLYDLTHFGEIPKLKSALFHFTRDYDVVIQDIINFFQAASVHSPRKT